MLKLKKIGRRFVTWAKHNRKQFFVLTGVTTFAVVVGIPVFTYFYFAKDLGSKESILTRNEQGVVLLDRKNKPFFTLYDAKKKEYIPLSQISKNLQKAVLASEDKDFYTHPGFSLRGILRAAIANVTHGEVTQGASTLTQQLVKNVLLSSQRSFLRKYQEIVLAIEVDRRYTKEDVLEMYLNAVYYGEGAFGAEQAAQTYFDKDASELTIAESAMLAGILPAPSAYNPISGDRDIALKRQKMVLRLMEEQHVITAAEKKTAEKEKLTFAKVQDDGNGVAPHFALMIKEELIKKYGESALAHSGFHVQTTIDLDWQKFAEDTVKAQVASLVRNKATNGALVAIDPTSGEIMALVGSHNWSDDKNGKINMALAPRQPGSSFKPLVYATAMENRLITAGTILEDKVKDFGGGYKPQNYDRKEHGNVTVRWALDNSLNIPAVEVMQKVGVNTMLEKAKELNITTLDRSENYGLSLVLGSGQVPLVEMTNAYAAFANEGQQHDTYDILEIRDKKEKVIYKGRASSARTVFPKEVTYIISSIISDNKTRAPTFGNALAISRQAAVKTGTTENYRDALTIGYTPQIVVGVWVGNNDNKPMDTVAGSLGAAPIWRKVMEHILQDQPVAWFSKPFNVIQTKICTEKGLKLEAGDDKKDGDEIEKDGTKYHLFNEYYIRGTEPDKSCFGESPTPDPTKEAEDKKKREEEERKKKEEENKKNATATPAPTNTSTPPTPTAAAPLPTNTVIPKPTNVVSTLIPTATPTPSTVPILTP